MLFANNLTAVPDTKDDIFVLRCCLCELTRKPDCHCFAPCLAPATYTLEDMHGQMLNNTYLAQELFITEFQHSAMVILDTCPIQNSGIVLL